MTLKLSQLEDRMKILT